MIFPCFDGISVIKCRTPLLRMWINIWRQESQVFHELFWKTALLCWIFNVSSLLHSGNQYANINQPDTESWCKLYSR
jgi:hypothetical protein